MNPYILILVFFTLAGLVMAAWGWRNMRRTRMLRDWSMTEGIIDASIPASEVDDLLPRIEFSYEVAGQRYRRALDFPSGLTPSPELARKYIEQYPAGAKVNVYYNPAQPAQATLERKSGHDDWFIVAIGLSAALFGLGSLLLGG